jgi:hypothetical protein
MKHLNRLLIWEMPSSGMLRHVALLRTDVSEKRIASIICLARIGELGTTLAVNKQLKHTAIQNIASYKSHTAQHLTRRHSFIVTAVKPSNLTWLLLVGNIPNPRQGDVRYHRFWQCLEAPTGASDMNCSQFYLMYVALRLLCSWWFDISVIYFVILKFDSGSNFRLAQ